MFDTQYLQSQLFWTATAFVFLLGIMWKYVIPNLNDILEARATRIKSDIDNAKGLNKEAEKVLAEYKKQLEEARHEAGEVIATARAEAEQITVARKAELEADIASKLANASQQIEIAKNNAIADLRSQVSVMAVQIAEKIILSEVDASKAEQYTDTVIKDLN